MPVGLRSIAVSTSIYVPVCLSACSLYS